MAQGSSQQWTRRDAERVHEHRAADWQVRNPAAGQGDANQRSGQRLRPGPERLADAGVARAWRTGIISHDHARRAREWGGHSRPPVGGWWAVLLEVHSRWRRTGDVVPEVLLSRRALPAGRAFRR